MCSGNCRLFVVAHPTVKREDVILSRILCIDRVSRKNHTINPYSKIYNQMATPVDFPKYLQSLVDSYEKQPDLYTLTDLQVEVRVEISPEDRSPFTKNKPETKKSTASSSTSKPPANTTTTRYVSCP